MQHTPLSQKIPLRKYKRPLHLSLVCTSVLTFRNGTTPMNSPVRYPAQHRHQRLGARPIRSFEPCVRGTAFSVFSRSITHGTPSTFVSSRAPSEFLNTTRASGVSDRGARSHPQGTHQVLVVLTQFSGQCTNGRCLREIRARSRYQQHSRACRSFPYPR